MRLTRIRASRTAIFSTLFITLALITSLVASSLQRDDATAQGIGWLSTDSVSYLTSSGIPVMVPGWVPGPVSGSSPEIYAGGGSYSIYFYSGSSFLFITGVAGGGFPGGSEANLNVELSINASVQGWPAIQDIGIPEGSETPIYDKVMWIADGVYYTVSGNGLDTDSLTLANSSVALYAQAPDPVPTDPPVVVEQPAQPVVSDGGNAPNPDGEPTAQTTTENTAPTTDTSNTTPTTDTSNTAPITDTTNTAPTTNTTTTSSQPAVETSPGESISTGGETETVAPTPTPTGSSDGTSGAWFTGGPNGDPSDGTDGANPPFLGGDGTGGPP